MVAFDGLSSPVIVNALKPADCNIDFDISESPSSVNYNSNKINNTNFLCLVPAGGNEYEKLTCIKVKKANTAIVAV